MGSHRLPVVAQLLRQRREAAGLTQDRVTTAARGLGLNWTRATVAAIEIGRRELSLAEFVTLRGADVAAGELDVFFAKARAKRGAAGDDAEHMEAEIKAARRLGVEPGAVVAAARRLWGRTLTDQRDALVRAAIGESRPAGAHAGVARAIQARRGHVTRVLVADLSQALTARAKKK